MVATKLFVQKISKFTTNVTCYQTIKCNIPIYKKIVAHKEIGNDASTIQILLLNSKRKIQGNIRVRFLFEDLSSFQGYYEIVGHYFINCLLIC